MKTRLLAGIPAAIAILYIVLAGSLQLATVAVLICSALAYLEYDRLFLSSMAGIGNPRIRQFRNLLAILLIVVCFSHSVPLGWFSFWMCYVALSVLFVLGMNRRQAEPYLTDRMRAFAFESLSLPYIVGLFGFIIPIFQFGRSYILLLFFIVFLGDTLAYFVGVRFGRRRLAPVISPKKSIEGSLAAIVTSILVSIIWIKYYSDPHVPMFGKKLLWFTPVLSCLAQLGDLFESIMKRSEHQKDSGAFLPGHGGILDRVDGLAFAAPAFYFFLLYALELP